MFKPKKSVGELSGTNISYLLLSLFKCNAALSILTVYVLYRRIKVLSKMQNSQE